MEWRKGASEKQNLKLVCIIQMVQDSQTQVINMKISSRLSGRNKHENWLGGDSPTVLLLCDSQREKNPVEDMLKKDNNNHKCTRKQNHLRADAIERK